MKMDLVIADNKPILDFSALGLVADSAPGGITWDTFFDAFIQQMPVAAYRCDAAGFLRSYNQQALKIWGRTPKIGADLWCGSWKASHKDGTNVTFDSAPLAQLLTRGKNSDGDEITVMRPDGSFSIIKPCPQVIRNPSGIIIGGINILIDITAQKKYETEILASEERLRMAVTTVEVGSWEYNPASGIVNCDVRTRELLGFTPTEWIDLPRLLETIAAPDKLRVIQEVKHALDPAVKGNFDITCRVINRKTGRTSYIRGKGQAFTEKPGHIVRVLGIVMDITQQAVAKNELEQKVADKTKELRQTISQLERSNHELEQFAYIASHDLQEPLRKIQTFCSIIDRRTNGDPVLENYVAKIDSSAGRLSRLIGDVLDYSTLSHEQGGFTNTDLGKELDTIISDFEVLIREKKANVTTGLLPIIKGIPHQLRQLFSNLLSNSLKFSADEPDISITSEPVTEEHLASYNLNPRQAYTLIRFRDNGIGFDQKYAERIFLIFQRLHSEKTTLGTGIGLALCRKIVDNHHGIIVAESEQGIGTTIKIFLPVF